MMTYHIHASIKGLLKLNDRTLSAIFNKDGDLVRKELIERLANGEKIIPSDGCDNYNQEQGCLGHSNLK